MIIHTASAKLNAFQGQTATQIVGFYFLFLSSAPVCFTYSFSLSLSLVPLYGSPQTLNLEVLLSNIFYASTSEIIGASDKMFLFSMDT